MRRSASILLLALLFPLTALAQADTEITFLPRQPDSNDVLTVTVSGTWPDSCVPRIDRVQRDGAVFRILLVHPTDVGCLTVITPWSEKVDVGPLAPGVYRFDAVLTTRDDDVLASKSLTVVAGDEPFRVQPAVSPVGGGVSVLITAPSIGACPDVNTSCAPPVVRIGGVTAEILSVRDSAITVRVPPNMSGLADVEVVPAGGRAPLLLEDAFLFYDRAQPPDPSFEWILFPMMYDGPGGYGSQWTTMATVVNEADFAIDPWNRLPSVCPVVINDACPAQFPPRSTTRLSANVGSLGSWPLGYVLYVPSDVADRLHLNLRVRDMSRQNQTWGTEIPVVRESELRTDGVVLADVPLSADFRRHVRVYAPQQWEGSRVRVSIVNPSNGEVIARKVVELTTAGRCVTEPCFLPEPAAAQMFELDVPVPLLPQLPPVHVVVEPVTEGLPFWAFATVTHKETQSVTTITPQ